MAMTREEAIYCMKSYIDDPNYEHCTSCPYYGANQIGENVFVCNSGEAHKIAVEALEHESNKWISVSERLPNLDDFTGTRVWQKKVLITGYLSFDDTKELFVSEAFARAIINNSVHDTVVVAWMPLPEPYKAERSDQE